MDCFWFTWLLEKWRNSIHKSERLCYAAWWLFPQLLCFYPSGSGKDVPSTWCIQNSFDHRWFFVIQKQSAACDCHTSLTFPRLSGSRSVCNLWVTQTVWHSTPADLHTKGTCYWSHPYPVDRPSPKWQAGTKKPSIHPALEDDRKIRNTSFQHYNRWPEEVIDSPSLKTLINTVGHNPEQPDLAWSELRGLGSTVSDNLSALMVPVTAKCSSALSALNNLWTTDTWPSSCWWPVLSLDVVPRAVVFSLSGSIATNTVTNKSSRAWRGKQAILCQIGRERVTHVWALT